jgi:hypothetical protein
MRLLQLSLEPGDHTALDLHPRLSVVQGLDELARDRLVRTVSAVASGTEPPCTGTAEAHGVTVPLDGANLSLLDLRTEADPVIRRIDLPGAVADAAERGEHDVPDLVGAVLEEVPPGVDDDLDVARRRHHDTAEALRVLRGAADITARDLAEAVEERRRLSESIAAAAMASGGLTEEADELAALGADLAAVEAGIAELHALDLEPVRVLVEAIEDPEPTQDVPVAAAQALAGDIARLHADVAALEERLEVDGHGPVSALARLERARAEAQQAELAMVRPPVTGEDEAELRRAHEAVLEAERKASGFRSRSGQRKLAKALEHQQEILDRVGYPTWSAYVMGASLMGVDAGAQARLEDAEHELGAAEAVWAEISEALDNDPEHRALLDELEDVEVQAIGVLLDHGAPVPDEREDLERSLRELRVSTGAADPDALVDTLGHALGSLGLTIDPDQPERTLVTAHALLQEYAEVPARLEELQAERRRLEVRMSDARSRAEARAWEALEVAVDQPADDRRAELEAAVHDARAHEEELAEALEARQALVEAAADAERGAHERARARAEALLERDPGVLGREPEQLWSEVDPEAIELYLMARLSAIRDVSYAGSVPLVLVDPFRGLPEEAASELLATVDRISDTAQVLLVTDDALVAGWASDQGDGRAAVVSIAPAYV